jgi:transcription elongation GreA/GreB family factor
MHAMAKVAERLQPEYQLLVDVRQRLDLEIKGLERELEDFIGAVVAPEPSGGRRPVSSARRELQKQIRLLEQLLAGFRTVTPEALHTDRVGYGSTVFVRDLGNGEEASYTLVAGETIDLAASQVSMESPMGQALLGHLPGDEVVVDAPHRRLRLRIVALKTLPQQLGL